MEKYIINPLEITQPGFSEELLETLTDPRLHIISGANKTGKTALCFKLMHLFFQHSAKNDVKRIYYLYGDHTWRYWFRKFEENDFHWLDRITLIRMDPHTASFIVKCLETVLKEKRHHLLILDGIYNLRRYRKKGDFRKLFKKLIRLSDNSGIPVVITKRSRKMRLTDYKLTRMKKGKLPVSWHIDRPEYMGKDIVRRGDARLLIY